jgi:hypothetical protein
VAFAASRQAHHGHARTPGKLLHLVQTLDRLAATGLVDIKVTEIKHRCRRAAGGQGTRFQPITVKQYRKRGTL